jgi:hypothetical protein
MWKIANNSSRWPNVETCQEPTVFDGTAILRRKQSLAARLAIGSRVETLRQMDI